MKLVIDIPEEEYAVILANADIVNKRKKHTLEEAVINGMPLPKMIEEIKAEIRELDDINPDYPMDRTIHISRNEVFEIIDSHISR